MSPQAQHYHLQRNDFGNEEVRRINPLRPHLSSASYPAEQLVKIPFKKFIVQFCSNPSQQAQLWNFHLNWFMCRAGKEVKSEPERESKREEAKH